MKIKRISIFLSVVFVILLVFSTLFISCGNNPTSTTTAVSNSSSTAPSTQSTDKITLKIYTEFPIGSGIVQECNLLKEELSKISNGRIELTVYPSEQLGPINAVLDLLKNGITDLAIVGTPRYPTLFPLENGQELALSVAPDFVTATNIRNQLTYGEFGQAFPKNNLKFLSWNVVRPMQFALAKKVTVAEDFKGLKVRSANPLFLQAFQPFGLVPVSMPMGEVYESLQRGVIDGILNAPENMVANKWHEVAKFYVTYSTGYGGNAMVMSKSSWDSLPKDIQDMFEQIIPQWLPKSIAYYQEQELKAVTTMKSAGGEVFNLDSAETERWVKLEAPIIDDWANKNDAPGVAAKAMVEQIRKLAAK